MRVLSKPALLAFILLYPDAAAGLMAWWAEARKQDWQTWAAVKQSFRSADRVGDLTVFNIGGDKYRLVCHIRHDWGKCFIKHVFTHAEYDDWNRSRR